jgi:tetratricopeptide (TPR) repeat protein
LSPGQILARLEQALPLLAGGPRDAPERQRTLAATIAWSYEMLIDPEQRLFARLSAFVGGCTLEAAETVCAADVDRLASLVDKSLVQQSGERFWMLETIREFALERLREHDTLDEIRRRHADFFLAGAEANYGQIFESLTQDQLDWFEREHDNLRAALDYLHEADTEPELEVRLALACVKFWIHRGFWREALRREDAALERAAEAPPPLRARLLWLAVESAWNRGAYDRGRSLAEASIDLLDRLGTEAVDAFAARNALSMCEQGLGNIARAVEVLDAAVALARASGNDLGLAIALGNMANLALGERDFGRARAHLDEAVEIARRLRQGPVLANTLVDLGFIELAESGVDEAAVDFAASLSICRQERVTHTLVWSVEGLAAVALAREAPAVATGLLATTGSLRTEIGFAEGYYAIGDEVRERTLEGARELLGEAAFATAWLEGENMSLEALADAAALVN